MFLVSGVPGTLIFDKMKQQGFRYFVSLMTPDEEKERLGKPYHGIVSDIDFCVCDNNIIVSRYSVEDRRVTNDDKAVQIAITILLAIGNGLPVVLHCYGGKGRAGTIAAITIGLLYGIDGDKALEIVGRLFQKRENKGQKVRKSPQTKAQISQVKRILDKGDIYKHFYV